MTDIEDLRAVQLRRGVYGLLIALALGSAAGRILAVNSVDVVRLEKYRIDSRLKEDRARYEAEGLAGDDLDARLAARRDELTEKLNLQRPFLSSNDRSRWANVRALVEHGTFAIDEVVSQPGWDTIDMVKHKDRDGVPRLYSSKPPLLATLLAGPYWVVHRATGETLGTRPYVIGRGMLLAVNGTALLIFLFAMARLAERLGTTDWGRLLIVATAALGTFLTTFVVVLNNHLIAAAAAALALLAVVRILQDGGGPWDYALAGLCAAFTAANELPALAFLALVGVALFFVSARTMLLAFLPPVILVAAAFFGTNYAAHASWTPPYAHRSATDPDDNWYKYTFTRGGRERQSYWNDRQGIDRGEAERGRYALHVLVGHHGILSLTPIWLLSLAGIGIWLARGERHERELALGIALLTLVCIGFYLSREQVDRNYGGMTSGFRWAFWFAPLWLVAMLPAADRMSNRRLTRFVALVLLALSTLSASYPTWNPWTHPWATRWMEWMGRIEW